uniref:Uncharacterized protein n=2 Tax=Iconisemion striatum TaxID=60296 RepID=A0A1A7YWG7_9TELE
MTAGVKGQTEGGEALQRSLTSHSISANQRESGHQYVPPHPKKTLPHSATFHGHLLHSRSVEKSFYQDMCRSQKQEVLLRETQWRGGVPCPVRHTPLADINSSVQPSCEDQVRTPVHVSGPISPPRCRTQMGRAQNPMFTEHNATRVRQQNRSVSQIKRDTKFRASSSCRVNGAQI